MIILFVFSACSPTGSDVTVTPYNLGNDTQDTDVSPYASENITLIKIEVPSSTTIQSLSMFARRYTGTSATAVRMAVYTNSTSGYADTLVVGSTVQTILTGAMQLLTFDVVDTEIPAGTYWVGLNADVDVTVSSDQSLSAKDVCYEYNVSTGTAWPENINPSRSTSNENNLNIYMTVAD